LPFAFDVFKYEVRLSPRGNSGIQKFGDIRMRKPAENCSLTLESLFANSTKQPGTQELDRSLALKASIATLGQPHRSHAAISDWRNQAVRSNRLTGKTPRVLRQERGFFKKPRLLDRAMLIQKLLQVLRDVWMFVAERFEPLGPVLIG
jgi:Lon protease-like protein